MAVIQKHIIFGAGLIGGFLAGCLQANKERNGFSVSVVGRESMRARFANNLRLTDYLGNESFASPIEHHIQAPSDVECDVLWLTVKATDVESAIEDIKPIVKPNTTIICSQNGLGSSDIVQSFFPDNNVIPAIVAFNVAQMSDHHLHRGSLGTLILEQQSDYVRDLVAKVNTDLLPTQGVTDYSRYAWGKLQLNLTNALNALADVPVRAMLESRPHRVCLALAMQELLSVTDAMGMTLPKFSPLPAHWIPKMLKAPNFIFMNVGRKMLDVDPTVRTSMWWDLHNGKLTEIDLLNGAVIDKAKELGIDCPVNEKIVEMVHASEQSETKQAFIPSEFLKYVAIKK